MKISIFAISTALLFMCVAAFAGTHSEQLRQEVLYPVLRLRVLDSSTFAHVTGTAVVVYSGMHRLSGEEHAKFYTYAITADHVVKNHQLHGDLDLKNTGLNTSIIIADAKAVADEVGKARRGQRVARVVARDSTHDLALLMLLGHKKQYPYVARLQGTDDAFGTFDSVWTVGAAIELPPFPSRGNIAIPMVMRNGRPHILTDVHVNSGDSGGGVFRFYRNCDCYKLIGITEAMPKFTYVEAIFTPNGVRHEVVQLPDMHLNLAIPVETVRAFLKSNGFGFILNRDGGSTK